VLEFCGLGKRYGARTALRDLSFTVRPGEMFGFVGPNGSGKTTAMRIAMGVLEADEGEVRWRGTPVGADARRGFGYMPEERGLYPKMRVTDQLVYLARLRGVGRTEAREATARLLDELGVAERARDRLEALSLGNQQRVQLAAALVHGPDLLVLDEPFSGLDPVGVDTLAGTLAARVREGAAVVFSSHQLDLVERLCHAVGIIRDGGLVATGGVHELRTSGRRPRVRLRVADAVDLADRVRGAPGLALLDAARVDDGDGGHEEVLSVELRDADADQRLLDLARGAGRLRELTPVVPTLAELFREAVADDGGTTGDGAGTEGSVA
jgi:ABC-2 type transport system ATP-binding protein